MAEFQFSTQGIDTESRFDALPPGQYQVVISESDFQENAKGTGRYIKLTMDVQTPDQYRGRKLWSYLSVVHQSQKTQEIARQQFAQLVKACGFEATNNTEELHHIPVTAIVKVRKDDTTQNDVVGFKPALHAVPSHPQPMQQQMYQQPAQQQAPMQQPMQQAPAQPMQQQPMQQPTQQPMQQPMQQQAPAQPAMATPPWMNQGR